MLYPLIVIHDDRQYACAETSANQPSLIPALITLKGEKKLSLVVTSYKVNHL